MNGSCPNPGSARAHQTLLIAFLFCAFSASSQPHPDTRMAQTKPPVFLRVEQPDSIVHVIVEFNEPPLLLSTRSSRISTPASFYRERFARFAQDANRLGPSTLTAHPRAEFYKLFFGVGITIENHKIGSIEQLPYVRRVHSEKRYRALGTQGLATRRSPEDSDTSAMEGDGVLVGIIDSGVDYLHPALGGGIGPGFKVVGGFDFVNGDPDPMDDNGHGTHVAGIVAADGVSFRGVAPKAKILAYKVLNAAGQGSDLDIIAALERSADPNQDGDPADMPDILNLSLGSDFGDPDDPVSTAVDNAVRLGMTVCVAAGNAGGYTPVQGKEGNYYFTGMETIASPGTARLAITVGAVDSLGRITRFSSKGPSAGIFAIKPDVVAPGEGIWSLAPGGTMTQLSGTSMATPMVAGVAALLRSNDGSMTPAEIKSAIMNSSQDLGLPVFKQGAGRIDAMRALSTSALVSPGHLSFGLDDPSQHTWTKVETLRVTNTRSESGTFLFSVTGNVPGVTLTVMPSACIIPGGSTQDVQVTLVVNNTAIPIVDEDIIAFDGRVHVAGPQDTLHIPWAFVRTSRLFLSFSEPRPSFLGASASYFITPQPLRFASKVRWLDARHLQVTGAFNGTYDFAVYFPSVGKLVIKERFLFHESGELLISADDAIHTFRFDGKDEKGAPFPLTPDVHRTLRAEISSGFPLFVTLPSGENTLLVSAASSGVRFHPMEALIDPGSSRRVVLPQYASFNGVASDRTLSHAGLPYRKQTLRFADPVGSGRLKVYADVVSVQRISGTEYFNNIQLGIDTLDAPDGETGFNLEIMQPVPQDQFTSVAFHVNASDVAVNSLDYSTRYFSVVGDSVMASFPGQRTAVSHLSPPGGTMRFGGGPVHILNLSYNNSFGTSVHFQPLFRGSLLEDRYTDYTSGTYTIFGGGGEELGSGPLNLSRAPFAVSPGPFLLKIESEHVAVNRSKGKVTLLNAVDLSKPVPDAPSITSFAIYNSANQAVDRLTRGDTSLLRFSSIVQAVPPQFPAVDSTRAFFRKHRTAAWNPLALSFAGGSVADVGGVFEASLSPAMQEDSVGIDLRVRIVDALGNASDMVIAPAFAVGPWVDEEPADVADSPHAPLEFRLDQNYPNPCNPSTVISYQLPSTAQVLLAVYDMLGREVKELVREKQGPGNHDVTFDGNGLASGVYFYRLQATSAGGPDETNTSGWIGQTKKLILLH